MRCGIQARALQFLSRRFGKGHCNAHPSEDYRENSNRSCNDFKQPVERIFGGWLRTWQRLPLKRCISSEVRHRLLHAKHTAPTGARALSFTDPATPVMESATRA